jgi:hypothetical protein
MHIHTYQINNVLNAYRKQLSQNSVKSTAQQPAQRSGDRIHLSAKAQRPKIVDNISSQIIDRMTKYSPESEFSKALSDQLSRFNGEISPRHAGSDPPELDFTYTKIDERNHKTTGKLKIQQFKPLQQNMEPTSAGSEAMAQQPHDALADNEDVDISKR